MLIFNMAINFTPFTYLFIICYSLFLFILVSLQDFFSIWILMELIILLFLGISYTLFSSRFSSLILYFLIQTLASFSLFSFYILTFYTFYTFSIILKLAIFPFHSWFLSIIIRFPNSLLLLSITFHKIPPLYLLIVTYSIVSPSILWASIICSIAVSRVVILLVSDFRLLLVSSSIGNNSWFILAITKRYFLFSVFFIAYFLSLLIVVSFFYSSSNPVIPVSFSFLLSVWSLSGLPPFPLFFAKSAIIFLSFSFSFSFLIFLALSSLVLSAYVRSIFYYISFAFTRFPLFLFWEVSLLFKTLVFKTKKTKSTSRNVSYSMLIFTVSSYYAFCCFFYTIRTKNYRTFYNSFRTK